MEKREYYGCFMLPFFLTTYQKGYPFFLFFFFNCFLATMSLLLRHCFCYRNLILYDSLFFVLFFFLYQAFVDQPQGCDHQAQHCFNRRLVFGFQIWSLFPVLSTCFLSVEKFQPKNKFNQRSEKIQKQRKTIQRLNNSSLVIKQSQASPVPFQGLQIIF